MDKSLKELMMDRIYSMKDRANWDVCLKKSFDSFEELKKIIDFKKINRVYLAGCGTSMANALIGESFMEGIAKIPAKAVHAFSFAAYTDEALLDDTALVLGITGAGVTTSVETSLDFARKAGAVTLAVTGNPSGKCAQAAGGQVLLVEYNEGPTVRTTSNIHLQLGLFVLALGLGEIRGYVDAGSRAYWMSQLDRLIDSVPEVLSRHEDIIALAKKYHELHGEMVFVLGAGPNYGTAWEGSLMSVEMGWIDSAAYETEEFTHGRFRECDERKPLLFIAPYGKSYTKLISILTACRKAGAPAVLITDKLTDEIKELSTDIVPMPEGIDELLTPLLYVFPLWLFDYAMGEARGVDPAGVRYGITAVDINRASV